MVSDQLIKRLMGIFLGELEEHMQNWQQNLKALSGADEETRAQLLTELYRTAHSLKGAGRSVHLPLIVEACHELEALIGELQEEPSRIFEDGILHFLLYAREVLVSVGEHLHHSRELEGTAIEGLIERLESRDWSVPMHTSQALPRVELGSATQPGLEVLAPPQTASRKAFEEQAERSIRLGRGQVDSLLAHNFELVIAQGRLDGVYEGLGGLQKSLASWPAGLREKHETRTLKRGLEGLSRTLRRELRSVTQATEALGRGILRTRMVALREGCDGYEEMVSRLGQSLGKKVRFEMKGGDLELDRGVLASLKDPLLHLVRNAVDHGVEVPGHRLSVGKPEEAVVRVEAQMFDGVMELRISDDGRGLDFDALRMRLIAMGEEPPVDVQDLAHHVFSRGFSTAVSLSDVSGRGMGLDVVRSRVEGLHGTVGIESEPGQGCCFTMHVPLTTRTVRGLLVRVADALFVLPVTSIERLVRVDSDMIGSDRDTLSLPGEGAPLPLCSLAKVLSMNGSWAFPRKGRFPVVMLTSGVQRVGFWVDELLQEQELVVMNLGPRLQRVQNVAGATLLKTGDVVLILHTGDLIRRALQMPWLTSETADSVQLRPGILVVDDSMTVRSLLKGILEAEGYDVLTAVDGQMAWDLLETEEVQLVVSDIEMPKMNGFELVERIRGDRRLADLPVILVSGLEQEYDRARGLRAGASAYLVKSTFEQGALLTLIQQLV